MPFFRPRPLSIALALLCAIGSPLMAQTPQAVEASQAEAAGKVAALDDLDAMENAPQQLPLAEIRRFVGAYNAIRQGYVEPVDDARLMHAALRGLLLDLDPHSVYFDAEEAREFSQDTSGAYDGVGLELQQEPGPVLRVIAPLEDGPGDRAGVQSGDVITAIDGKPIDLDNGSRPLRGAAGTQVRLTIERAGRSDPFDVVLVRERIRLDSVQSRMLEPGIGYVRISSFQSGTALEFRQALARLQGEGKLAGLVLDLRSNPGGLLGAAVQVADDLLESGVIVSTRGRLRAGQTQYDAHPGDLLAGAPLVVLVDAGSASASEVLAGALQDLQRAQVIGSRTFGKGSVQSFLPLDNGDAIKLTTALYYTPGGRSIQGVGITPDVWLQPESGKDAAPARGEAQLPGHLQGEQEGRVVLAGENAGHVLGGDAPIRAAVQALKQPPGKR